jgi:transcriptional regulator with XRE-family HTH domain
MSSAPTDVSPQRRRLADELRRLRIAANLSGEELGDRIGISQSKVSKIENLHRRPTLADVRAWTHITDAPDDLAAQLVELAEAVLTETTTWRTALREGLPRTQQEVAELEATAALICNFQPGAIPGLLQTPEYARRLFELSNMVGEQDFARAVIERMNRQAILQNETKRFEFVFTEAALRYCPGPPRLLLAQLDRVAAFATLPNVNIGFIPHAAEARTIYSHGFVIYDQRGEDEDPIVKVETLTAGLTITDSEAVETYRRQFARLQEAALYDEEGLSLLHAIAADVRQLAS